MKTTGFVIFLLAVFWSKSALACNGYKARLNSIVNCGKYESVIKVKPNANATITENCEFVGVGCLTAREAFSAGKAKIVVKLNGLIIQRLDQDICDGLTRNSNVDIANILKIYGVPEKCPIPTGDICASESQKISLGRFKEFLELARGKIEIFIKVIHDVGKTCVKIDLDIFK